MNVRVQLPLGCLGETETELSLGHALSSGTAPLSKRPPPATHFSPSATTSIVLAQDLT